MTRDLEVLARARDWIREGRPAVLATVVATWGSAPRREGSLMAITRPAAFVGSVSGGCVETAVVDRAQELIEEPGVDLLRFGVTNEMAWEVGLACGGEVEVHVASILPGSADAETVEAVVRACERGGAPVLAFWLDRPGLTVLEPAVDLPTVDTAEAGPPELRAVFEDRTIRMESDHSERVYRPFNPPPRVILIGAVHIAQTLAPMLRLAGFQVVVVDPRSAWLTPERFPDTTVVAAWPDDALADLAVDHRTAVVTLSHDPKLDDPALRHALASPAFYVGALGSRRTHARRVGRLQEEGIDEGALARIHAPVGLDLGGRHPAEIAVAIAAEIVRELRLPVGSA